MSAARRVPGYWFTLWLCAFVLGTAGSAHAQSTADELGRTHFDSGAAYMEQGDYEASLREFKAAYELSKRPEILLNVGTVNERLGRLEDAVTALETYLSVDKTGERTESLKLRIENLKKRIEQRKAEATAAAPASVPVAPAAALPPPEAAPRRVAPAKTPALVLFAVGGGLAIGSVVTGLLASHEHSRAERDCSPTCSDGELSTGRALAVTSTVLTGAAVVATAVGAVLFFGGGETPPEPGKPVAFVHASPLGVSAGTRVVF